MLFYAVFNVKLFVYLIPFYDITILIVMMMNLIKMIMLIINDDEANDIY